MQLKLHSKFNKFHTVLFFFHNIIPCENRNNFQNSEHFWNSVAALQVCHFLHSNKCFMELFCSAILHFLTLSNLQEYFWFVNCDFWFEINNVKHCHLLHLLCLNSVKSNSIWLECGISVKNDEIPSKQGHIWKSVAVIFNTPSISNYS